MRLDILEIVLATSYDITTSHSNKYINYKTKPLTDIITFDGAEHAKGLN